LHDDDDGVYACEHPLCGSSIAKPDIVSKLGPRNIPAAVMNERVERKTYIILIFFQTQPRNTFPAFGRGKKKLKKNHYYS
jgi:hypothetical protein